MLGLPLNGVRVVDVTDGLGESCGRFLADLGAEVIRVEPPGGSASRRNEPIESGISIPFALNNANKRVVVLDLDSDADRSRFVDLVGDADILIETTPPGSPAGLGLSPTEHLDRHRELVAVSISGFGQTGPYSDWAATESVIYAMSGVLSRSGEPGREPLLPPAGLVEQSVGVHAAWSALLAYYDRLRTGRGQLVDISAFEAVVHGFDPGFGVQGSAAAGRRDDFPRGRPDAANFYPVLRCADGQVRICLLAKRQWRAMFSWLGEPAEFADPAFDTIPARFAAADRLHPLIEELFAGHTRDELVAEGAVRGIPIGGVLRPSEVLDNDHFAAAGTLVDAELAPGVTARIPSGYVKIDGQRAGFRHHAQAVEVVDAWSGTTDARDLTPDAGEPGTHPFTGLRVLDLGVVVFGAELGRQFADHGADVIKVENRDFPDGLRQSKKASSLAASVAWGHRNRRSLGVNLRTDEGRKLFRQLAADADVVLANFKPGTLDSMGIGYEELREINPRIIVSDGSAFGSTGPWNTRLGYGPLVRAACGVSALWRYSGSDTGLSDGSTVYPDHIGGQVAAVAVLAALIARLAHGRGAEIEVAQADTALVALGGQLVRESLAPGSVSAVGNTDPFAAPAGVYPCTGDDEWCVVAVRDDRDWRNLTRVIGRDDLAEDVRFGLADRRIENRDEADKVLTEWLSERTPTEAMTALQEAGVPAGAMVRLPELLTDPHLVARDAYTSLEHPLLPAPLPTAVRVARFTSIPDAPLHPAPLPGADTHEVAVGLLGLDEAEYERCVAAGILQPLEESAR
ncbi:CoA transferase [Gordonia jinghuaiqii]|uniref:CoA transferase n=1 Tax=Gordonia jinghuaiqii TaxID=2758710 RepID=A0A7D7LXE2_9ACTN|nr:CoA transferase [Gordonia jinghuaiqii]MCR5977446.1 CoA transferase [Gordonia jinghuaiqii]QMT02138.1 CoA transferase [Gordonia jinghuaiqii]